MPHKYEREIEEILRNMEQREPQRGMGERVRQLSRQPTVHRAPPRRRPRFSIGSVMVIGIVLALVAAGLEYYFGQAGIVTGALALAALVCILIALLVSWSERFVGTRAPRSPRSRAILEPTPIGLRRRGLFSEVATQFRIFRLKLRYWRNPER